MNILRIAQKCRLAALSLLLLLLFLAGGLSWGSEPEQLQINDIRFNFNNKPEIKKIRKYELLLDFKRGGIFSYKQIRKSIENLYAAGSFENIAVRVERLPENRLNIDFDISSKYVIESMDAVLANRTKDIEESSLIKAIYSFRVGSYYKSSEVNNALNDIENFLESRGYLNSKIDHTVSKNEKKTTADLIFYINPGPQTRISETRIILPGDMFRAQVTGYFQEQEYLPYKFQEKIDNIKNTLKKRKYYFPEVEIKPVFLDETKTKADLEVHVNPGFKYIFYFQGMKNRIDLISSIWEEKRFEKWAEQESKARILYHLKNNGYLEAEVESTIETKENEKHLTFLVKKNKKYRLGKIRFSGNKSIPSKQLLQAIQTDDQIFDTLFWLRAGSLYVDLGVIEQVYHFHGFPTAEIQMQPNLQGRKADIEFMIREGEKWTVESILFDGNHFFDREKLLSFLKTKENSAFVQQVLGRDIETLIGIYHANGFADVTITPEISGLAVKSILIKISEGRLYKMGNLVIIGASTAQEQVLRKIFPLAKNSAFNSDKVEQFKEEIESSAIFNEVRIDHIYKSPDVMDVLVRVTPDRSKYYGVGVGWEDRKGLRSTLEYQGKNTFNSDSTLSAMVQYGINERRGLISYDTPYFFKNKINSSFKIWADSEVYPSYSFNRYGFGESLIRKMTPRSYILASLSWYRTELAELHTSQYGVDKLNVPFDTTAFNFSYVRENRDDPFNPTTGDYFSTDIKVGFPLFEKSYSFIKFLWSYQKNFKFLKYGVLAFSVRNGFASGDMSITERFFAGGVHTFRGTKNDYLSPTDMETGKPRGGNAMILFNVEATFPFLVIPMKDLYYSIFYDTGNVFDKVNDFDMKRLEKAIGFSLKIKTQMGPIRVDFGWYLQTKTEAHFEWNIGIGNVF